jgi:hypothetical protein
MNFESILSRCDIENYQKFLGADIIGTLGQLDSKYLYAKELDRVLLNSYSPFQLLSNPDFRSTIFLLLREGEAIDLLNALGKQVRSNPGKLSIRLNSIRTTSINYSHFSSYKFLLSQLRRTGWTRKLSLLVMGYTHINAPL